MRKLATADVFSLIRLLKKTGLKEEVSKILKMIKEEKTDEEVFEVSLMTLFNILESKENEQDLYAFLSGPFEMEPNEIAEQNLEKTLEMMIQMAKENSLSRFFGSAGQLMEKLK